jgi:PhzF family phenazine biosynthesis protein
MTPPAYHPAPEIPPGDNVAMTGRLFRYAAFATTPDGGNPAGVWVGDALPPGAEMQSIAADVACPVTAFLAPAQGFEREVRYFSVEREVDLCGHATIASGVHFGRTQGEGEYRFATRIGTLPVRVRRHDGLWEAEFASAPPRHEPASATLLRAALAALHWSESDLDPTIPPARIYAGNWHLLIAAQAPARLAGLDYDYEPLKALMMIHGLATLQLVWRERPDLFHARDPFPVGGVVEDPATGSGAAALGGYLRDAGLLEAPATLLIRQGEAMGRPSRIAVHIPAAGSIMVSGNAVPMETPA